MLLLLLWLHVDHLAAAASAETLLSPCFNLDGRGSLLQHRSSRRLILQLNQDRLTDGPAVPQSTVFTDKRQPFDGNCRLRNFTQVLFVENFIFVRPPELIFA